MPWVAGRGEPGRPEQVGDLLGGEALLPAVGLVAVEQGPGLGEVAGHRPGQHGGVPLADHQGEGAAGAQDRGDRLQGTGRVVDETEHAVAQHQVDATLGSQLAEVAEVALETGDPVGDTFLVGPAGQGGEGVGAGVDDRDPVALGGDADRETAGAATDVEDGLLVLAVEQRADGVPDHRGAGGGTAFQGALHVANPRGCSLVLIRCSRGCGATACGPPRR